MYTAIIVDDESVARHGISTLLSKHSPLWKIVGSFADGQSALQFIKKTCNSLDLIISDICMPNMNGLELIRVAKTLHPSVSVIFVSGYDEFEYARSALTLKADAFLLKPLVSKEFYQELDRILEIRKLQSQNADFPSSNPPHRISYLNFLFNELLRGNISIRPLFESIVCQIPPSYHIVVLKSAVSYLQDNSSFNLPPENISNPFFVFSIEPSYFALILTSEGGDAQLQQFAQINPHFFFGISQRKLDAKELSIAYQEAYIAVNQSLYSQAIPKKYKIFIYQELKSKSIPFPQELCIRIVNAMGAGDLSSAENGLTLFFTAIRKERLPINQLEDWIKRLLYLISNLVEQTPFEFPGYDVNNIIKKLPCFQTLEEIHLFFSTYTLKITKQMQVLLKKRHHTKIEQIKQYVHIHYAEDLSLERLSEHFGISASHISNLFHTVTGTKLISYITNIRLEEAKKLLRNTDDCIYHIALQVGFSDAGYFNRIFKKEVGISPKTYRNFTKNDTNNLRQF